MTRWRVLPRQVLFIVVGTAVLALLSACATAADLVESSSDIDPRADESPKASKTKPTPTQTATLEPPPETGCRDLVIGDLDTVVNDSPTVNCKKVEHTAVTFKVGKLPRRLVRQAVKGPTKELQREAQKFCQSRFRRWIGGSDLELRLTMFDTPFFLPDGEQRKLGATWVRCDVVAYAVDDGADLKRLYKLPNGLKNGMKSDRIRDLMGRCGLGDPGGKPDYRSIICWRPHPWRAVDTYFSGAVGKPNEPWPGTEELQSRGTNRCEPKVRAWLKDQGEKLSTFNAIPYNREAWRRGLKIGICWAQTKK